MSATADMGDDENWTGGFYELFLVLGAADDARLDHAVRSLWRAVGIAHCRRAGLIGVVPSVAALDQHGHLRGTVVLPSGGWVVCGAFSSRYKKIDRLKFYLPLGALARVDRRIGGFPFDERSGVESLAWRTPLDRWLADVAITVHADVPFQHASSASKLTRTPIPSTVSGMLPP